MLRAIIRATFTFLGISALALSFLASGDIISMVISGLIFIGGIYASYYVFRLIKSRPFGEINNFSSPDLDHLIPTAGSGVKEIAKEELVELYQTGVWKPGNGVLKIWGDWKAKNLDKPKKITAIAFNKETNQLVISFSKGRVLVLSPRIIHITSSSLKIMYADKILWNWEGESSLIYEKHQKEITRASNIEMELGEFDVDVSQPALLFY
ncbi:hypothetical protein [Fulvivirga lutimaris]|uniref:hypothetical protein n=1 Tax=Fulvivirga lutimaris TaxID=1819566 RepID=UPI0012BCECAB|nr:hypothetical protein [Fulvivirga lutimaris]MTI41728.1 hypothetical protein [Fulvivirga lutimaris]